MDKYLQTQLLLEYIAQSNKTPKDIQNFYKCLLDILIEYDFIEKSIFTCKHIESLLHKNSSTKITSFDMAKTYFQKSVTTTQLDKEKKTLLYSLLKANFSQHAPRLQNSLVDFEASLNQVESKMYAMITLYIELFLTSLDTFIFFDTYHNKSIEEVTNFALKIHSCLIQNIFYKEEQELLDSSLKKLAFVYIGLYCKEFYT